MGSMIFGIGLPRCGGQTLHHALATLTGKKIMHSPGRRWGLLTPDYGGAVECFAPIPWLLKMYPGCKFVWNMRDFEPWLASCQRVYNQSHKFNHPLWLHPLEQFEAYREDYYIRTVNSIYGRADRFLRWDITANPSWEPLCEFLELPVPHTRFPNVDRVGR